MIKIKKNYFKVKLFIKKLMLNRVMACAYIMNRIAYIFGIDIPPSQTTPVHYDHRNNMCYVYDYNKNG